MAAETGKNTKNITRYQLEVTELIREMQNMTKEGKDAGTQLATLGTRFSELKTKGEKLEGVMRFYAARTKDSAKATANLNTRLSALNTGVGKVTAAEKRLLTEVKKVAAAKKKEAAAVKKDTLAKEKNAKATNKSTAAQKKSSGGLKGALGTLLRFGAAGAILGGVMKTLNFAFVKSFQLAVEFEKALGNLAAVGGVAGKDLDNLKEAALGAAGATKFTANEIIVLQTELSKLGFTADEVVNSTKAIAIGAQALGAGLGETAVQVGKLINQFGLLSQDSDVIVDTLVTTINESALSLQSYGVAIQYVGPISRDLGISLQETSAAMAVLADNGFTASRIGTGLRGILTELGSETVDVKSKLKDLAEENLSLAEAVDLVGKRNAAQLITLLSNIDALDEASDVYYQQGRALSAAAEQATTFSGQMELVSSAVNEAQINFGNFILETGVVQEVLGYISNSANETYKAFELLKNQGIGTISEDLGRAATGLDPFTIALERVAKDAGVSAEKVKEAFQSDEVRAAMSNLGGDFSMVGMTAKFEDMIADTFGDGDLADTFQGYLAMLNEEIAKVDEKNLIAEQRNDVDDLYLLTLQDMIEAERNGIDVKEQANTLTGEIHGDKVALIKASKELNEEIKTDSSLNAKQIADKKRLILAFDAQSKALEQYERRFANFVLSESAGDAISKLKARTFKEEIDILEDSKDAVEKNTEVQILASEASGNMIDAVEKRIMGNEDLTNSNNEIIALSAIEKKAIEDLVDAESLNLDVKGNITKQAASNIKTYEKEIETLDNIIEKYNEKNEALENNSKILKDSGKALKDELKNLESEYERGDIGTGTFLEQREAILKNYTDLLKDIAAKSPELQAAVDALLIAAGDQENPIDWKNIIGEGIDEAIDVVGKALEGFSKSAFENTKNRLEAEKDALKARYETEDFLAKQQFENGLINESQYRRKQAQLRKKQVAEENAIDKKIFDAEQKRDKDKARTDYLEALASIVPGLIKAGKVIPADLAVSSAISAALATAAFGAEMGAIGSRKFFPKKFATGGMVNGPSHEQGGVPFSVQGQGGYEMEGGEFIVNKRAASLHRDLLDKINGSVRPNVPNQPMTYAQGGVVSSNITNVNQQSSDSVNYLKAIAEATSTNAMNSSRPVRAFVTSTDLRRDESARRIKDNNTTI